MARRKSKFLSDDDDSDSSADSNELQDDPFDPNDEDQAAERELFAYSNGARGSRGKKRTREDIKEDATYGVFAQTSDQGRGARSGASKTSYLAK